MKKKHKKTTDKSNEFEDWHKPEYEEDPNNAPRTFKKLPKKFETNFLSRMDKRTVISQLIMSAYNEIVRDVDANGGLSHIKNCLIERFCFLEFVLRYLEMQITNNPKAAEHLLGKWVQGLNSLVGLGRTLGLKRAMKRIDLKEYIEKSK